MDAADAVAAIDFARSGIRAEPPRAQQFRRVSSGDRSFLMAESTTRVSAWGLRGTESWAIEETIAVAFLGQLNQLIEEPRLFAGRMLLPIMPLQLSDSGDGSDEAPILFRDGLAVLRKYREEGEWTWQPKLHHGAMMPILQADPLVQKVPVDRLHPQTAQIYIKPMRTMD
jgi:hypothetical protein